jgi:hypothetical protein
LRGLDPRIHIFADGSGEAWMAGSSPAKATGAWIISRPKHAQRAARFCRTALRESGNRQIAAESERTGCGITAKQVGKPKKRNLVVLAKAGTHAGRRRRLSSLFVSRRRQAQASVERRHDGFRLSAGTAGARLPSADARPSRAVPDRGDTEFRRPPAFLAQQEGALIGLAIGFPSRAVGIEELVAPEPGGSWER